MTKKKESHSFINFGFSTILLFFVMICVITFSVLSFTTSYSDYKLSKKVADKTSAYYDTQELLYERLLSLDYFLWEKYQSASNETEYYKQLEERLLDYGTITTSESGMAFSFQESISDGNYLAVTLLLSYPKKDTDTFYKILEWKSVYEEIMLEDEPLNLLQ